MPYIHKSGKQFGLADISITTGVQCREVTQAQYDALSATEKNNGTVYFITDGTPDNLYISDTIPIGAIQAYGGTEAPNGWLMCDGSAVNRIVYRDLFAVIGITYGEGDTVTTFNLPNLKGRVAIGADTGYALGSIGGEETHQLTTNELPAHKHHMSTNNDDFNNTQSGGNYGTTRDGTTAWYNTTWYTDEAGGDQPHNNMQPYVVTNYIIKAKDTYQVGTSGSGGGGYVDVDSTAVPAPNMVSEFDDDAKMNSTDMTDAEIESYFENITYNPMIVNDTVPIGAIQAYGGEVAPNNWLICDGSAVSRTTYSKLFATIGTTYGEGDGETTFNIPDLRGNIAIGASEDYDLGDNGGESEHILTTNEMPSHSHELGIAINGADASYRMGYNATNATTDGTSYPNYGRWRNATDYSQYYGVALTTGGSQSHNNMQPYIVTNYIIKANDNEVTGGQLQALTDFFYPIGSYYETSDDTFNPNVSFGGTWVLEDEGQVHVSAGSNYEIGDTGGKEKVTLSAAIGSALGQASTINFKAESVNAYQSAVSTGTYAVGGSTQNNQQWSHSTPVTDFSSAERDTSIMQPYIVVNRWHRTA